MSDSIEILRSTPLLIFSTIWEETNLIVFINLSKLQILSTINLDDAEINGVLHPDLNLAGFVCHLKFINFFFLGGGGQKYIFK